MAPRLFTSNAETPLAVRLRPNELAQFVGQQHLVGTPTSPLQATALHSCLLWGPPGCGKTTLAHLLAARATAQVEEISPVSAGVAELRKCVARAQARREDLDEGTVVFVDEAHRFNKAQQDYFLPHVESGLLTFIGATTENPSFEINAALLSRLTVYRLDSLSEDDLRKLVNRAIALCQAEIEDEAVVLLIDAADGDARRLLNIIEQLAATGNKIDTEQVRQHALASLRRFDKRGDEFYDQISAMIKSIRGSDPDAALYWLCRMLDGGADPLYMSRRLIRIATEDVGLADPGALAITINADEHYRRLGSPEGELGLAQAAVYLACAPKSNAVYKAYKEITAVVTKSGSLPVPKHLRNAPTELMKEQGNTKGYRYAHDEEHGYAAGATYLPPELIGTQVYVPTEHGFEERVAKRLKFLRSLDAKK